MSAVALVALSARSSPCPHVGAKEDDMGKLRDRMAEDLKLRGLRLQTIEKYLYTARNFVAFYGRPPTELGAEHVRRYLLHLTEERKLKAGTINTYLGGIRFL